MKKVILLLLGVLIIAGSFFPWYSAKRPGVTIRFFHNYFFGIPIHSNDSLLSFHGFPIVLGIVLIVSVIFLSKANFFRTLGIISIVIILILLLYDGIHFLVTENEGIQTALLSWGYWMTFIASIISLILIIPQEEVNF